MTIFFVIDSHRTRFEPGVTRQRPRERHRVCGPSVLTIRDLIDQMMRFVFVL